MAHAVRGASVALPCHHLGQVALAMPCPMALTSEAIGLRGAAGDTVRWTHAVRVTMHLTRTETEKAKGLSIIDALMWVQSCPCCSRHFELGGVSSLESGLETMPG
jgi:hypothetical protein